MSDPRPVIWFDDPACDHVSVAGGKGASLSSMVRQGLPVPDGFVIPAGALEACVDAERLRAHARAQDHAAAIKLVEDTATVPHEVAEAYEKLGGQVAVRSSASAEDSEAASYAGQQETYLNVAGAEDVRRRVTDCWASFFSERALFYRGQKGSLDDLAMAVVVQQMVDAEKAGVTFSIHPVTRRRDRMLVEAVRGLGEQVVSGEVTPDHYVIDRKGRKKKEDLNHGGVLSDADLEKLATLAVQLEDHYRKPQDIEWAIAGDRVFLLQSRPVTT
jgi:pyruvate,water dikinase